MRTRHEADGHSFMSEQGFEVDVLPTHGGAVANIDMRLNGLLWELKTVNGSGSSLNARFDEAVSKWERLHLAGIEKGSKCRVVIDNRFGDASYGSVLDRVAHNIEHFSRLDDREDIEEALVIQRNGKLLRIKKTA